MKLSNPSRRVAVLALASAPLLMCGEVHSMLSKHQSADVLRLTGIIRRARSARIVGEEYLSTFPEEASEVHLLKDLRDALCLPAEGRLSEAALAQRLNERCAADFREGHVLQVHRCWLSLTELKLCGLVALMHRA